LKGVAGGLANLFQPRKSYASQNIVGSGNGFLNYYTWQVMVNSLQPGTTATQDSPNQVNPDYQFVSYIENDKFDTVGVQVLWPNNQLADFPQEPVPAAYQNDYPGSNFAGGTVDLFAVPMTANNGDLTSVDFLIYVNSNLVDT
jgi:hypothetical protein